MADKNCYDKLADALKLNNDGIDWEAIFSQGPHTFQIKVNLDERVKTSADAPAPKVHFSWLIPEGWFKEPRVKIESYKSITGIVTSEPVGREGIMVDQHNDRGDK